jgi:TRAP-type C4-dicarboxylate transport system permease small subunit
VRSLLGFFERLFATASTLLLVICFAAVVVQIVMRYLFNNATTWSDPVAADSLAWMTFLGATAAVRRGQNLTVRFVWKWFGPGTLKVVETTCHIIVLIVSLAIAYSAKYLLAATAGTQVEGLLPGISLADVYSVTGISAVFMFIFTVEHITRLWRKVAE